MAAAVDHTNPPLLPGIRPLHDSEVTPAIGLWAKDLLNDPLLPMFGYSRKFVSGKDLVARADWHPPSTQKAYWHRGTTIHEVSDAKKLRESMLFTTRFHLKLKSIAEKLKMDPLGILAVIWQESRADAAATNPFSNAVGLIQFMPFLLKAWNTTPVAVKTTLSAEDQLDLVERFFNAQVARSPINSLGDTYVAVFWPAAIGKPDDYVISTKGNAVYDQNVGLDVDKNGVLSAGDVRRKIEKEAASPAFQPLKSEYLKATSQPEPEKPEEKPAMPPSPDPKVPVVMLPIVPGESPGARIIRIFRSYVGCSLTKRRADLGRLVARGVDKPEAVVGIATNCATSALGVMALAGVKHPLLNKQYVSGMAIAWVRQIGLDLGALRKYQGPKGPQPKPGSLLRYNTAGTNNDHVEWLLESVSEDRFVALHGGGGRSNNEISEGTGSILTSLGRPLVEWWDPDALGIDVEAIKQVTEPADPIVENPVILPEEKPVVVPSEPPAAIIETKPTVEPKGTNVFDVLMTILKVITPLFTFIASFFKPKNK